VSAAGHCRGLCVPLCDPVDLRFPAAMPGQRKPDVVGPDESPRRAAFALGVALACVLGCGPEPSGGPALLHWYVFREPSGAFAAAAASCGERSDGRYTIEIAPLPASADGQREQLVRRLAAHDPDIDLIGMDVIWTAEFATAGWILAWAPELAAQVSEATLAAPLASARFDGRLYAAPFTTNVQLLWYRTDLVERPPNSWDEMLEMAEALAERGQPHAIEVQGARYEGLTVWFNTLLASAGGSVLDAGGGVSLAPAETQRALGLMRRLARSAAAPPALATAREDEARLAFEAGKAAFMLNYTFVWPSARRNAPALAARMGWARIPRSDPQRPSRVTIGGLNLGVGAWSRHPELAFEAASCLREDPHQVWAATRGGLLPTREALYADPAVLEAFPFADVLRETLRDAAQRPATPAYPDVSLAIQRTLHPPRDIEPARDADELRRRVDAAVHSRGLL
jgi:trehalose/maltose transport system substrate-binding protein